MIGPTNPADKADDAQDHAPAKHGGDHGDVFRSLTPARPPFSGMNSTPAASKAACTAAIEWPGAVASVLILVTVFRCTPDFYWPKIGQVMGQCR